MAITLPASETSETVAPDTDLMMVYRPGQRSVIGKTVTSLRSEFASSSEQQSDDGSGVPVVRPLYLWGRFASPPSWPSTIYTDDGWDPDPSDAGWHTTQLLADLDGTTNPLYWAVSTGTRANGGWTQSAWSIIALDLPTRYTADRSSHHATHMEGDTHFQYRRSDGSWSPYIALHYDDNSEPMDVVENPLEWTGIAGIHLNNSTSNPSKSLTPVDLDAYNELLVVCREFASWSDYSSQAWTMVREARISLDEVEIVDDDVSVDDARTTTQQPIGCRFGASEAMIGIGQVDVTGGAVRGPFAFSFVFRGGSDGLATSIQLIDRGPNWSWAKIDFYLR